MEMEKNESVGVARFEMRSADMNLLLPTCLLSFIFFSVVYKISQWTCHNFVRTYRELKLRDRVEWDTRICSQIHSVILIYSSFQVFFFDSTTWTDPTWGVSERVRWNCSIVIGYMLSDVCILLCNLTFKESFIYIFHHFACVYSFVYVMLFGIMCWFANIRVMAEASNIFLNIRWYLRVLKFAANSTEYITVGILLSVSFFIVRVLPMPFYWTYFYWYTWLNGAHVELGLCWHASIMSCIILDSLNSYWFFLILKGIVKTFNIGGAKGKVKA